MIKRGIVIIAVIIELGEYVIPEFNISVAVTAYTAGGLAAAILFTSVKIQLGAGSAGTFAVLPEVIFFTKSYNTVWRYSYLLCPDIECLIIFLIYGYPDLINRQVKYLCAEFPRP